MPAVYRCPSDSAPDQSQTSYAMIVGPHAISDGPTSHRMKDIKDGPSHTVMVVNAAGSGIDWMEPRDLNADKMNFRTRAVEKDLRLETCEIFRSHGTVANVLFCDGSVRHALERIAAAPTVEGTDNHRRRRRCSGGAAGREQRSRSMMTNVNLWPMESDNSKSRRLCISITSDSFSSGASCPSCPLWTVILSSLADWPKNSP